MLLHIKADSDVKSFIKLQEINENMLSRFLEFFEYAIYKMSWILNYNKNPVGGSNHTHGGVIDLLNRIKVSQISYEKWLRDSEHGFLHGFCTLYMAYCLHPDKQALWDDLHWYERRIDRGKPRFTYADNLIVSCLIHDFMRHVTGDENHDEKLVELTPLLLPETYNHSNPSQDSLLSSADRLELMRYHDCNDWVDFNKLDSSIKSYGGNLLIGHFYKHIRPVIEKLFLGRYDIWFSHALEVMPHPIWQRDKENATRNDVVDNLGSSYYPKFHWTAQDEGYKFHMKPEYEKYFSVHSGKLPISNCIGYTKGYYRSQAFITLSTVKKYGCEVSCAPPSTAGRDHLFIIENNKIPTTEWCFLYDMGKNLDNQFYQIELNDLRTMRFKLFNSIYRSTELFLIKFLCLCCN